MRWGKILLFAACLALGAFELAAWIYDGLSLSLIAGMRLVFVAVLVIGLASVLYTRHHRVPMD